jgi:hypothetical protein
METEEKKSIAGFFVVELMGKTVLPGFVQEEIVCGTPFLRIDVPAAGNFKGFTKLIHPQAVFALNPADMELCRRMAENREPKPFNTYIGEYREEEPQDYRPF